MIRTVRGDVPAAVLGPVLIHEHVLCDIGPPGASAPITPADAFATRWSWGLDHPGHHRLDDVGLMSAELADYARAGGSVVVDLTVRGIAPDPAGLAAVSAASGVHIVAGTGWYTAERTAAMIEGHAAGDLARQLVRDLDVGVADTGVRAGIVGEIGCSWPLAPSERTALAAAARAQAETGVSITVHPGRHVRAPFEILDVIRRHGGDVGRTIIGHLDRTLQAIDTLARLADTGCGLEWDFFGINDGYYPFADVDLPHDGTRLDLIHTLAERGHDRQLLVSHDICTRSRLRRNGGHGYAHLLHHVVPYMRRKRFSNHLIDRLTRANPLAFLTRA